MKKCLLTTALLFCSSCFAVDIEGKYECFGNEVDTNASFKCEMNIKKTGNTYASTSTCSDGNSYSGTGIYNKKLHVLSTGFINPQKPEETGVGVCDINSDGTINIVWTYLNKTSTGNTNCSKQTKAISAK